MFVCPRDPERFKKALYSAILQRANSPRPLIGAEEQAWDRMVKAITNSQFIAAAIEAGQHPVTQAVFEAACDADRQDTH